MGTTRGKKNSVPLKKLFMQHWCLPGMALWEYKTQDLISKDNQLTPRQLLENFTPHQRWKIRRIGKIFHDEPLPWTTIGDTSKTLFLFYCTLIFWNQFTQAQLQSTEYHKKMLFLLFTNWESKTHLRPNRELEWSVEYKLLVEHGLLVRHKVFREHRVQCGQRW